MILPYETFEGTFPPAGWNITTVVGSTPWSQESSTSYKNGSYAYFDYSGTVNDLTRLVTPYLQYSTGGLIIQFDYNFYTYQQNNNFFVAVSIDNGVSWNMSQYVTLPSDFDSYPTKRGYSVDYTHLVPPNTPFRIAFK